VAKPRRVVAWILFAVWVVGTFVTLSVPIQRPPSIVKQGLDKTIHTGLFVVMGVLGQAAAPWAHLLFTGPYSFGVEWIQKKLPTRREYNTVDLASNIAGLVLGVFVFELATRLKG
jgi:VanZ family protein